MLWGSCFIRIFRPTRSQTISLKFCPNGLCRPMTTWRTCRRPPLRDRATRHRIPRRQRRDADQTHAVSAGDHLAGGQVRLREGDRRAATPHVCGARPRCRRRPRGLQLHYDLFVHRYPETVRAAERASSADAMTALLDHLIHLVGGVTERQVTKLFDWSEDRVAHAARRLEMKKALVRADGLLVLPTLGYAGPVDIHQLRSWIFELYEPLENERQYIVYDEHRGNLLIDAPPFSERALRLVRGAGPASLLVATNAARAVDAGKYREALGLQVAAHADDAEAFQADLTSFLATTSSCARTPARSACAPTATARRSSSCGRPEACWSAVTSTSRATPHVRFCRSTSRSCFPRGGLRCGRGEGQPSRAPGRAPQAAQEVRDPPPGSVGPRVQGRLEDKLVPHDPIVPREVTAPREAAMGPETLVVATSARELVERPRRPLPATPAAAASGAARQAPAKESKRPKNFAEDWDARGTEPSTDDDRESRRRRSGRLRRSSRHVPSAIAFAGSRSRSPRAFPTSTTSGAGSISRRTAARSLSRGTAPARSRSTARRWRASASSR